MNILAELQSRFRAALEHLTGDVEPYVAMVRPSQNPKFGDFQANCAMSLAKEHGAKPRDVAAEIVERLDVSDFCEEPEIAGPGFINLKLKQDWLEQKTNRMLADDRLGITKAEHPKTIVIDYSSPNVAKPMHVGHLRSTVIGAALYKLLGYLGHRVIGDNHIGDWGTQFGMIIYGYKHFRDEAAYQKHPVEELARLYKLVNQLCDYVEAKESLPKLQTLHTEKSASLKEFENAADPKDGKAKKQLKQQRKSLADLEEEIKSTQQKIAAVEESPELSQHAKEHPDIIRLSREETARLHAGDAENKTLWDEFLPYCLETLHQVYDRLGIRFDYTLGESFYDPMLADVVQDLKAKGLAQESDGAECVFLEGHEAPFIVRKSDGAYNYATTDLATIQYRHEKFHADALLYVVDKRQSEHFEMLFKTAKKWGYDRTEFCHVSFGTIMGKDGKPYKTRSGGTVGLEGLLDESITRARKIVDENDDAKPTGAELDEAARADVAEKVGLGGIKYADLKHNRDSDYVFEWDKMLATRGDTATYMQYSYARVASIFRKGGVTREEVRNAGGTFAIHHPAERALALQLLRFGEALEDAAADYRPNLLTQYLFDTANLFSTFFENCPVLKSAGDLRESRLLLSDLTGRVLATGLELLGIETCEQM